MRVRRVVTRRGRHIRGYFPSKKMSRMVAWESLLERDALLLLELSPGVEAYQEQPEELSYWDGEAIRGYVPDLLVSLHDERSLLIEIKPITELERPKVREKYTQIAQQLQTQGRDYRLLTENEIRCEPQFGNLQHLLYHYNHPAPDLPSQAQIAALFRQTGDVSLALCLDQLGSDAAYSLIAQGQLFIDLSQLITPASLVRLPEGGRHAALFF